MNERLPMHKRANYLPLYVRASEIEDIDALAERARELLTRADGFYIAANDFRDSEVVDPVRLSLAVQIGQRLSK